MNDGRWRTTGAVPVSLDPEETKRVRVVPNEEDLCGVIECESEEDAALVCRYLNQRDRLVSSSAGIRSWLGSMAGHVSDARLEQRIRSFLTDLDETEATR